jgi:imidazolonepropionase-like amidohydrolase
MGEKISIPRGAEIIDGQGKTLMPGLIDAHVHVWDESGLRQALVFGVTTVIDMFTSVEFMTRVKRKQAGGSTDDMSYLISSGVLATAPDGHGTEYGISIPTLTLPEEAPEFVDERIREGSDFIKIIDDDGSNYGTAWPTLNKSTIEALIAAAHQRNKMAVVHIATLKDAIFIIQAGADGLAHLFSDDDYDPDFGKKAAEHGTFIIPTFSVLKSISGDPENSNLIDDPFLSPYLMEADRLNLKKLFPTAAGEAGYHAAEKALRQLRDENISILAGTDAPNPGTVYGASLHGELALLVRAGLSSLQALKAATSVPAEKFGLTGRGRIEKGCIADLVLVQGNPAEDILATRDIEAVWRNGVKVQRDIRRKAAENEMCEIAILKKMPPPEGSESGLISDFESGTVSASFGAGWSVSTDAMMGGTSAAELRWVKGGAKESRGAMVIAGTVAKGSPYVWAGALFSPGKTMMAPVNLSGKKTLSFRARGDGKKYAVMFFAESFGFIPATRPFTAETEWALYSFPFENFGTDGHDLMGIFIGGAPEMGDFQLLIDDIRLE